MEPRPHLELSGKTEFTLVNMATIGAQRVEFLLYGLGSHLAHYSPIRISNMVLPTVKLGPPNWTKSRTFVIRFVLEF